MNIEVKKLSELKLAGYNPRVHTPEFLARLKKSIDEFGYIDPIIWNKQTNNVVGGHARIKVLLDEGVTEAEVSVVDLSPDREKLLNLQLNKNMGEWDVTKLTGMLSGLEKLDVDLDLTGFTELEINDLLKLSEGLVMPESLPDVDFEGERLENHVLYFYFKNRDEFEGAYKLLSGVEVGASHRNKSLDGSILLEKLKVKK